MLRAGVIGLMCVLCAGTAVAQSTGAPERATPTTGAAGEPIPEARYPIDVAVTLFGTHAFESDFSDIAGGVGVTRAGLEVGLRRQMDERSRLSLSIGLETSNYDFSSDTALGGGGEPWDNTVQASISAVYTRQATQQWSWFFGGGVDTSFELDANVGKSFTGGLFGGAAYAVNENLSIGGGVAVRSRLEDSGLFLPIVSLDWKFNDQWRLSNSNELNSTGAALSFSPNERLTLSLHAAYQGRAFRLDEDGPFPDGVGRDSRIPVWLQARYAFSPRAMATVAAGYVVWQEYTILDQNGNELDQQEADGTPFVAASVVLLF
jgi:hypothetical protein